MHPDASVLRVRAAESNSLSRFRGFGDVKNIDHVSTVAIGRSHFRDERWKLTKSTLSFVISSKLMALSAIFASASEASKIQNRMSHVSYVSFSSSREDRGNLSFASSNRMLKSSNPQGSGKTLSSSSLSFALSPLSSGHWLCLSSLITNPELVTCHLSLSLSRYEWLLLPPCNELWIVLFYSKPRGRANKRESRGPLHSPSLPVVPRSFGGVWGGHWARCPIAGCHLTRSVSTWTAVSRCGLWRAEGDNVERGIMERPSNTCQVKERHLGTLWLRANGGGEQK